MKELVYILALTLSTPAGVKHIENKYHVEYTGKSDADHRKWWIFTAEKPEIGTVLIATPEGSTDDQFETSADIATMDALFQYIVSHSHE